MNFVFPLADCYQITAFTGHLSEVLIRKLDNLTLKLGEFIWNSKQKGFILLALDLNIIVV